MKVFVCSVIICALLLHFMSNLGFIFANSWTLVKYAIDLLINSMVLLVIVSFAVTVVVGAQFVCTQFWRFRNQGNHSARALNDEVWMIDFETDVPGQSGDHLEFFDIPELVASEDETNRETRRRRPRMMSTILRDSSRDSSRERRRINIEESLRESEEFITPLPSPRLMQTYSECGSNQWTPPSDLNQPSLIPTEPEPNLNEQSKNSLTIITSQIVSNEFSSCPEYSFTTVIEESVPPLENISATVLTKIEFSKPILHQFPRGMTKPSLSCDGMFLETYIRLIGIACDVRMDCVDSNGPWIDYQDKKVYGAQNCIKYLKECYPDATDLFTVDGKRRGTSWSLTLLVDHLYWGLMCWRWVIEGAKEFALHQPGWNRICENQEESMRSIKNTLWAVGFGKMSYQGVSDVITKDFETLSEILGPKSFLLGETPTEVDCYAFSVLCQIEWGEESLLRDKLRDTLNTQNYCIRVRNLLWSDWDSELAVIINKKALDQKYALENIQVDENFSDKKKSSHFTESFYQLLQAEDTFSDNETEGLPITSCSCDEDLIYICTRCTTMEVTTIKNSNGRKLLSDNQEKAIQILRAGSLVHSYGVEEYFDDDFEDMERISFLSNESDSMGERSLSPNGVP